MLTAKVADADKIMGLTLGADDYLTKPFNPLELLARVKTQLRRYTRYNAPREEPDDVLDVRGLTISRASHRCALYGREIALTPLEFSILWYLCAHQVAWCPARSCSRRSGASATSTRTTP